MLHLGLAAERPESLAQAAIAIDAMGALVDAVGDRFGPNAEPLRQAVAALRLGFVEVSSEIGRAGDAAPDAREAPPLGHRSRIVAFLALLAGGIVAAPRSTRRSRSRSPGSRSTPTLRTDGSMRVVEHLTYDFTGSFTYGTRPIPLRAVPDHRRLGDGARQAARLGRRAVQPPVVLRREGRAAHVRRRRTPCARGRRSGRTSSSSTGSGSARPTRRSTASTWSSHVPPGAGALRAWGHGPLNGVVRVGTDSVRWKARSVPQGTFVEGRVATPSRAVPGAHSRRRPCRASRRSSPRNGVGRAGQPGAREAATTRAARARRARRRCSGSRRCSRCGGRARVPAHLARWGREPTRADDIGKYFRELPDDPPAVVDALMHWGHVRPERVRRDRARPRAARAISRSRRPTSNAGSCPTAPSTRSPAPRHPPATVGRR